MCKPTVMISLREGGENGGPFRSHQRIIESSLSDIYNFVPLCVPKGRLGLFNIRVIKNLVGQMKSTKPDIVHFAGLQLEGFHVILACKFAGIKNTIIAIHGSSLEALNICTQKRVILNICEIITLRLSDYSYGVSKYVCSWKRVEKYSKNCFGHVYNISEFVETQNNYNAYKSFKDEISADDNDILIVSTGRITIDKGFEIIKDVIKIGDFDSNVKFIIVGEGAYRKQMMNELSDNISCEQVVFTGFRDDIDHILSECDIFLMCSLHETLCISVLEAGLHGLPSIVTDVGGLPEIIDDGCNGFLVNAGDTTGFINALEILINNEDIRKAQSINAKKNIELNFSEKEITSKLDYVYSAILDSTKSLIVRGKTR